jgi:hypothetical protein
MKLELVYLDTCLPDYFQGFSGHVYAVPLWRAPRNHEVRSELIRCIHGEELCDSKGNSVDGPVYLDLGLQAVELFKDNHPLKAWAKGHDLSESYAYFGVKELDNA